MNVLVSRLTSKAQTVIPKAVRERLGLKPGDFVRYVIDGKQIRIERAKTETKGEPFAVFVEWTSDADEKAYGSL